MKKPDNIDLVLVAGLLYGILDIEQQHDTSIGKSVKKVAKWLLEQALLEQA